MSNLQNLQKLQNLQGNSSEDGCPPEPDLPKSTPELILDTGKDVTKTLGILLLLGPKVISESGILEFIDWRLKNDECPKKEKKKKETRDPESSIYKVEKNLKDGLKAAKMIASPIVDLFVNTLPIKNDIKALLYILENEPCYFVDQLKIILITPGGNEAFVIRHFMAKLKKIVNYLKETSNEELEESDKKTQQTGKTDAKPVTSPENTGTDAKPVTSPENTGTDAKPVTSPENTGTQQNQKDNQNGGSTTVSPTSISPSQTLAIKNALDSGLNEVSEKDKEKAKKDIENIKKKHQEMEKCGKSVVDDLKNTLSIVMDYTNDYGNDLLISSDLVKKPDIYRLFLNLDILLADFLKKPEDTGVEKSKTESSNILTNLSNDLCNSVTYEECLEIGCDKTYDANSTSNTDTTSVGIGKSFVELGIEKFDYKYEDVCFVVDKEKLEIFIQKNKELKLMLIYLLEELTLYNQLSDKSLQDYMESSISGNELTEDKKKNIKNIEDKDIKKATEKEEHLKKEFQNFKNLIKSGGGVNKKTNKKSKKNINKRKINKKKTTRKI
jgi:hypothetical protein